MKKLHIELIRISDQGVFHISPLVMHKCDIIISFNINTGFRVEKSRYQNIIMLGDNLSYNDVSRPITKGMPRKKKKEFKKRLTNLKLNI